MIKWIRALIRLPEDVRGLQMQVAATMQANLKLMREVHALNEKLRDRLAVELLYGKEAAESMAWAKDNVLTHDPSKVWEDEPTRSEVVAQFCKDVGIPVRNMPLRRVHPADVKGEVNVHG